MAKVNAGKEKQADLREVANKKNKELVQLAKEKNTELLKMSIDQLSDYFVDLINKQKEPITELVMEIALLPPPFNRGFGLWSEICTAFTKADGSQTLKIDTYNDGGVFEDRPYQALVLTLKTK
jgi:hypothetical protein